MHVLAYCERHLGAHIRESLGVGCGFGVVHGQHRLVEFRESVGHAAADTYVVHLYHHDRFFRASVLPVEPSLQFLPQLDRLPDDRH